MKIRIIFAVFLCFALLTSPWSAFTAETDAKGFVAGLGPVIGYDLNVLKYPGGGVALQGGYRFNDVFSALAQVDVYYTRDSNLNYFSFPVMATVKAKFYKGAFVYGGGGYDAVVPEQGFHFRGSVSRRATLYNGFCGHAGFGYDHKLLDQLFISPQAGFTYARVGGINRMLPQFRVYFNWEF